MSWWTTSITNGRGLIVSRLPRGICKTRLIELGTTTTIRDPLSTLRFSHSGCFPPPLPTSSNSCRSALRGMNIHSCALVVKMMYPEPMVYDVAFDARRTCWSCPAAYILAGLACPMMICSDASEVEIRLAEKQNSGNRTIGDTVPRVTESQTTDIYIYTITS